MVHGTTTAAGSSSSRGTLLHLMRTMVGASEKGAKIAREIKAPGSNRRMSIEKKPDREKGNDKKVEDFMTVADILVQKVIIRELVAHLPGVTTVDNIGAEEEADASSLESGEVLMIHEDEQDTESGLVKHFLGDRTMARKVAALIHARLDEDIMGQVAFDDSIACDYSNVGFWIDPIDATSAYIKANDIKRKNGIATNSALEVVTTLVGAYDMQTGAPLAGVVNQPFQKKRTKLQVTTWTGAVYWGARQPQHLKEQEQDDGFHGTIPKGISHERNRDRPLVVHSKHEPKEFLETMVSCDKIAVPGSGYKGLCVLSGLADVYYLSLPTTYKWDTCSSHAIALAMGGTVLYADTLEPMDYRAIPGDKHANEGGFVMVCEPHILHTLRQNDEIEQFLSF